MRVLQTPNAEVLGMRMWDLASGTGKMEMSLKALKEASADIAERWNDETNRRFVETYVTAVEPRVKVVLDSIHRLAEVLATAERQCRDED
jgi:hypothetical protein